MSKTFDWRLINCFVAVCRRGSLAGAAQDLQISQPTVTRMIDDLEAILDTALFDRTARGCVMTQSSIDLFEAAETMADAAAQFHKVARASGGTGGGEVSIAVPDGIAVAFIAPHIEGFIKDNPDLRITIECGLWLPSGGALTPDVALSYKRPIHPNAVAKMLCHIHYCFFAAQSYAREHGLPKDLGDILAHKFIGHSAQIHQQDKWSEEAVALATLIKPSVLTNSSALTLELLRNGTGINAAPSFLVDIFPDLIPIKLPPLTEPTGLYLCTDKTLTRSPRVQRVKEWLENLFNPATNAWLKERFIDPHEIWKERNPDWGVEKKVINILKQRTPSRRGKP